MLMPRVTAQIQTRAQYALCLFAARLRKRRCARINYINHYFMRKAVSLALSLAIIGSVSARDYASVIAAAESLQYLKDAKAVAICDTDGFLDGGSLSFTFVAEDGKKMIFVLSAERQRKDGKRFLSVYQNQHIWLVPDASYDKSVTLLREKLAAGLVSGLLQKWPVYREDAEALCRLLKEGGHPKDLDDFYASGAKRAQEAHETFLRNKEKP